MKKLLLFILLIFMGLSLFAKVIAKIGEFEITSDELADKMEQMSLSKQEAFNLLFNDYLFLYYAQENGISVSDNELDDYFISELGDDPSLQTNGEFDYNKYLLLKDTPKGKRILNLMRKDILIKKSKYLVTESFNLDDENLLKQFLLDQLDVDIDYAVLDINSLDITDNCSFENARKFYERNKNKFIRPTQKIIRFSVRFFSDYADSAKVFTDKKIKAIDDTLYTNAQMDSLKESLFKSYLDSLSYLAAINDYKLFRSSLDDSVKYYETYPMDDKTTFDKFPDKIINQIALGDVALPFKTKYGYVTAKVADILPPKVIALEKIPEKVWKEYIKTCKTKEDKIYKYYKIHPDSFMANASLVEIIKLPKNTKKITEIQQNFFEGTLSNKFSKYRERKIVFLSKYPNEDYLSSVIADKLKSNMERGAVEIDDNYFIFRQMINYPSYLPEFSEIKNQLPFINEITMIDTSKVREYYEANKRNMVSPDSVKLGFAYFPFETDTIQVSEKEIKSYFNKNRTKFRRKGASLLVDYISVPDSITAFKIKKYLDRGDVFSRLKLLYNTKKIQRFDDELIIKSLEDTLKKVLDKTPLKSYSEPFYFNNGWVILYKKKYFNKTEMKFNEVKEKIADILKLKKARTIAYTGAKVVFDSTRYFSDCAKYVPSRYILKTKFQTLEERFDKLGDMSNYKDELLRIWKNVKLTSIVEGDSGYAVVYLLKKKYSKKLGFNEARPKIIKILLEDEKLKNAQKYAKKLRQQIAEGADPDSLLFFLGGWKKAYHLRLNSVIPGLNKEFSSLILSDISMHESGYISPVLKMDIFHLMFYKIERIKSISKKDFYKNKSKIKARMIADRMRKWLEDYKKSVPIKLYGF